MDIDEDKIDDAVLAWLTLHNERCAWKGFDWATTDRLHKKGMIGDPVNKSKSLVLTDEGGQRSEELFTRHPQSLRFGATFSISIHRSLLFLQPGQEAVLCPVDQYAAIPTLFGAAGSPAPMRGPLRMMELHPCPRDVRVGCPGSEPPPEKGHTSLPQRRTPVGDVVPL
jgi:hypothetical protein